jgi:hypothetical protein
VIAGRVAKIKVRLRMRAVPARLQDASAGGGLHAPETQKHPHFPMIPSGMPTARIVAPILSNSMSHPSTCVIVCDTLLREHLLAVRIYQEVLVSHPPSSRKRQIERILSSHEKNAADLRATLKNLGARAPLRSGLAIPHASGIGLLDLLRREETALARCEKLLLLPGLGKMAGRCIRDTVIPRFQKTIAILERLQDTVLVDLPTG